MTEPTPLALDAPVDALRAAYRRVRALSLELTAPLEVEDMGVQTMPSVSPPKWHLAHTTWYFETFVLGRFVSGYQPFHAGYDALFNSYYQGVGVPFPRAQRGTLSRPTVAEVRRYRQEVDRRVLGLLDEREPSADLRFRIVLGLNHEQQHQELLVTDLKHILGSNPLHPPYRDPGGRPGAPDAAGSAASGSGAPPALLPFTGGRVGLGHEGSGFSFDNERPRHEVLLRPFALSERLVTNGEFAAFVDDGGYRRPELWLADGWEAVHTERWEGPLYWRTLEGQRAEYTLWGLGPLDPAAPVCHVSYFEADAFARWAGKRLPSEAEWEHAATESLGAGGDAPANLLDTGALHPRAAAADGAPSLRQLRGDVWEWTQSPYVPYPGYRPFAGELGEYNGKFMCSQLILRGGSCATPADHLRLTYRNFFYPQERWQLTGIRLAADA